MLKQYPLSSSPAQRTEGRYMDGALYDNLKPLAKKIADNMTFTGIFCSSTFEVRTGKSVLTQQIGEAYMDLVNEYHGTNLKFTEKNIVFRPEKLIERAFELPKYSVLILDEWEDAHYWSKLGKTLREFFRRCGQLNLFILIICPNFFQLPRNYAISRSNFLIDVHYGPEFKRGFFRFYSAAKKKRLFIKGKKDEDYDVVSADFPGRFTGGKGFKNEGYAIDKELYDEIKAKDFEEAEEEDPTISSLNVKFDLFYTLYKNMNDKYKITQVMWGEYFDAGERTIRRWVKKIKELEARKGGRRFTKEEINEMKEENDGQAVKRSKDKNILGSSDPFHDGQPSPKDNNIGPGPFGSTYHHGSDDVDPIDIGDDSNQNDYSDSSNI